jgi:homoserine O-acetyltransferase/O-succinyltransferase
MERKNIVNTRYVTFDNPGGQLLACGQKLPAVTIAYETYGTLSKNKDNAVLIFHALSGDAHAAGFNSANDKKPGWWDIMIGPAKPFDTDKYFVICSNVIGGCKGSTGPSSINPETGEPYGLLFPEITINDMIKFQKKLLEYMQIERLFCIAGGSMGGMQALQWIVTYPETAMRAIIIAAAVEHSAQQIAFNSIGRYAIISDPAWNNGNYYDRSSMGKKPNIGLSIARMIGHITYISEESMHKKFGRDFISKSKAKKSFIDFTREFEVESYLQYQGESFIKRFDPNSYLYITKALDNFNLSQGYKNLAEAMSGVKSSCLILSFTSDWLYPGQQSMQIVKALKINGVHTIYADLDVPYGHDSFLIEDKKLISVIKGFIGALKD